MKVLSLNIWFDKEKRDERLVSLVVAVIDNDPDFICLQEVTPQVYEALKKKLPEFKYCFPETLTQAYGCVTMSKYTFNWELKVPFETSRMGRHLLCTEFKDPKTKKNFIIANSHLESEFNKPVEGIPQNKNKIQQIHFCNEILNGLLENNIKGIIFCSDSNVQTYEEQFFFKDNKWIDVYTKENDPNKEYTYDYKTNEYLKKRKLEYQVRVDRILKTSKIIYKSFDIIKDYGDYIQASDHHALLFEFSL